MRKRKAAQIRSGILAGRLWFHGAVLTQKAPFSAFWFTSSTSRATSEAFIRTIRSLRRKSMQQLEFENDF